MSRLLGIAMGGAIAVGVIVLGIDLYRDAPTWLTALSVLIAVGPIALWGVYMASQSLLALSRQIGRPSDLVDLDAPEIVIPRRRPPRVLPTLGALWFMLFIGGLSLSKFKTDEMELGTLIGTAIVLFFFISIPTRNLWFIWRLKDSAFAPIVLDAEGLLDRSYRDAPRIAWRDIAAIDLQSGEFTLTGERKKWAVVHAPDRRWFARLRGPRTLRFALNSYGLQPGGDYALSLIRAYWQRRLAVHDVDRAPAAPQSPQEERVVTRSA